MQTIISARELYPSYSLVVTGHSLGAAIGTLAAANLRNEGYTVTLVCISHDPLLKRELAY